jgi:hypothetical protein
MLSVFPLALEILDFKLMKIAGEYDIMVWRGIILAACKVCEILVFMGKVDARSSKEASWCNLWKAFGLLGRGLRFLKLVVRDDMRVQIGRCVV